MQGKRSNCIGWVLCLRTEWISVYHCHKENLCLKWYVPGTKI